MPHHLTGDEPWLRRWQVVLSFGTLSKRVAGAADHGTGGDMTYQADSAESREFGALGIGLILYSLIFVSILAYGWYFIVGSSLNSILAGIAALVLALLAWTLAKIVGSNERGIKGNLALFLALLLVSAVGVFNTLMIRLEGKAIFTEVIDESTQRFNDLAQFAKRGAGNEEVAALRARVAGLKVKLEQEIRNPRNCGDGPEANKILAEIRRELPGFIRYSGNSMSCENNDELVRMYSEQMDKLMYGTDIFVRANVADLEALTGRVTREVPIETAKLDQLRKEANEGASLISFVRPKLEENAASYQNLAIALQSAIPSLRDDPEFKRQLEIDSVRNLGEWGHLLPLFLSRLDKAQTWVYLAIAFFLDWLLVHLFSRIAAHRREMPSKRRAAPSGGPSIGTPWQ